MASGASFNALNGHNYILLTTFRKNGTPVATPVWFVRDGERLVIMTGGEAGKVKRLRHTPRVTIAPCTASGEALGETTEAAGAVLPSEDGPAVERLLSQKYGLMKAGFDLMGRLNGSYKSRAYLEIKAG